MAMRLLSLLLLFMAITTIDCNFEGDVLFDWKSKLTDPYNVLQSWDPTLPNPCSWFHVTCNFDNVVVRLDLGNAGLSGPLLPTLGLLPNLQYLEVFGNKIHGSIPSAIGNLTELISLDLYDNQLSGSIPSSLGNLRSLKYLRLNGNRLSGTIPTGVIQLVRWGNLRVMNVSKNLLAGTVHSSKPTGFAITTIVQDPIAPK